MLFLSEILIQNPQLESFEALLDLIGNKAREGTALHLKIDIKPPYPDTPANWEDRIEGAFSGVYSVTPIFRGPD